jgi:threonine synthase
VQERQFTTLGSNIRAFAVEGAFDDCQRLVKECFADRELHRTLSLTSANSINIGRLLPQIFYYFYAAAQLPGEGEILFSTPSGNFGNLTAGLMARALGLEARFIAATNINDVVPEYLLSGEFQPRASQRTVSNAMDVGNPSNFARILKLYDGDIERLRRDVSGARFTDAETVAAIRQVDQDFGYVMDPHTAVAYLALRQRLPQEPAGTRGIALGTAHPAKFSEVVEPAIGRPLELPEALAKHLHREVISEPLPVDAADLRRRLLAW